MAAVNFLPTDSSLAEVRASGRLSACMPDRYPPLVTGDPQAPGFDVELLTAVASRLGVDLSVRTNSAIGRDFNPRNWRVTRAQCHILAGGVVLSRDVQSFLDTVAGPLSTGWAALFAGPVTSLEGAVVGVYPGLTGLDRLQLARYLREVGARPQVLASLADLEEALQAGEISAGVTEALAAQQGASAHNWTVLWLPDRFERFRLGFGVWRGDTTLLRAIQGALRDLSAEGFIDALEARYGLEPIALTLEGDA